MTLRQLRTQKGLTQQALAEQAETYTATVSRLETGLTRYPTYETVVGLARALDTTPDVVNAAIVKAHSRRNRKGAAA